MDDDEFCPVCQTKRAQVKSLQLRYASCCGSAMCVDCIAEKFRTTRSLRCLECGREVGEKSFLKQTFGQQVLDRGKQLRAKFDSVLVLLSALSDLNRLNATMEDFSSLEEWNNHLEFIEDIGLFVSRRRSDLIVYATIYGTEQEITEAESRIQQYKNANLHIFRRNVSRDAKKLLKAEKPEIQESKESEGADVVILKSLLPSFVLPSMIANVKVHCFFCRVESFRCLL
jgi:hypothetical protein